MKTREQVNRVKRQLWWKIQRNEDVSSDVEGFEEHRDELTHYIEWIKAGNFNTDAHNLAAECGILDNMALACRLAAIEQRLDDIAYPDKY